MSVPAAWRERAQQHETAQRKLRAGLREKFPFAAKCGDELRSLGFKDAKVVEARNEAGEQYGEPLTGLVASSDLMPMFADDAMRRKRK